MKKKILLSSILTIAMCFCLIVGSTFTLFTSETASNVAVTAGKVNVVATIEPALKTWSLNEAETNARTDGTFVNGGTAIIDEDGKLVISRMTPGDVVKFTIKVANNSNIAVQYRVKAVSTLADGAAVDLTNALTITANIENNDYAVTSTERVTDWVSVPLSNGVGGNITDITVTVNFPNGTPEHDNAFKTASASIVFTVEAVQSNGVDSNGNLITP